MEIDLSSGGCAQSSGDCGDQLHNQYKVVEIDQSSRDSDQSSNHYGDQSQN